VHSPGVSRSTCRNQAQHKTATNRTPEIMQSVSKSHMVGFIRNDLRNGNARPHTPPIHSYNTDSKPDSQDQHGRLHTSPTHGTYHQAQQLPPKLVTPNDSQRVRRRNPIRQSRRTWPQGSRSCWRSRAAPWSRSPPSQARLAPCAPPPQCASAGIGDADAALAANLNSTATYHATTSTWNSGVAIPV
jgi:hypothetical protein